MNKLNKQTKGVLIFAFNNEGLDYLKIAIACAERVVKHWGLPVSIATDTPFDHPNIDCITAHTPVAVTSRVYRGYNTMFKFLNGNRHEAWDISPYDQTILIDCDLFVSTTNIIDAWDGQGLKLPRFASMLDNSDMPLEITELSPDGLRMFWATIVCFDRSDVSKAFFGYWRKAKQWYKAYANVYGFRTNLFRNDYCVTVALDLLQQRLGSVQPFILNYEIPTASFDQEIVSLDPLVFNSKGILLEYQKTDVHILVKKPLFPLLVSHKDYRCKPDQTALEA